MIAGQTLEKLITPALLLDLTKFDKNVERMHRRLSGLGVQFRPHGKTAKNIDAMRRVLKNEFGGLTVSTLREAEYYFEHGLIDMIYAVGIAPGKLERLAKLIERGADISVILDSLAQAELVAARAEELGCRFPVLIELDCDGHRSGVQPEDEALLIIGRYIDQAPGLSLAGLLTHAGESYSCPDQACIEALAEREREVAAACAARLRAACLPCPIVSVGSSPTATFAQDLTGVTEVRAGVYMTGDLVMAGLGVCRIEDIALSVLTTVIGWQKDKGWIIVDAGWTAMSRDRGTANQAVDQGYGLVCDSAGRPLDGLIMTGTNQEHGVLAYRDGRAPDWDRFPVGTRLRILPNHACSTATMFDGFHILNESGQVIDYWERCRGW